MDSENESTTSVEVLQEQAEDARIGVGVQKGWIVMSFLVMIYYSIKTLHTVFVLGRIDQTQLIAHGLLFGVASLYFVFSLKHMFDEKTAFTNNKQAIRESLGVSALNGGELTFSETNAEGGLTEVDDKS